MSGGLGSGNCRAAPGRSSGEAIPNFAAQTGQPCTACHIGAYGPQLTPLGRAFKIGGYTQRGGEGWQSYFPLSAMVLTSFTNTGTRVPDDQIPHALQCQQQFRAGPGQRVPGRRHRRAHRRFRAVHLFEHPERIEPRQHRPPAIHDDIRPRRQRAAHRHHRQQQSDGAGPVQLDLCLGLSLRGVRAGADAGRDRRYWTSAFAANSIGYTAYAWYDKSLYLEAGVYTT